MSDQRFGSIILLAALAGCGGESPPPVPDPLPAPLSSTPTPGAVARGVRGEWGERGEKTAALTCLPELPPGAEEALLAVRSAAAARDMQSLRAWMAEDFNWSFGGEPRADLAVRSWQEHPETLEELVATLDRGCLEDATGARVTCPPEYGRDPGYLGWRAGLERRAEGWRLTFFVAGD